jgi:hypothetical protein
MPFSSPEPGVYFTYGRKRLFFRTGIGLGQVIGVDVEHGVIHVRVFFANVDDDDPREGRDLVAVGHLPILLSKWKASAPELVEKHPVPPDSGESIAAWRDRHRRGEVGAFSVSLPDAMELVAETVAESGRSLEEVRVIYAFPKIGSARKMNVVEVGAETR